MSRPLSPWELMVPGWGRERRACWVASGLSPPCEAPYRASGSALYPFLWDGWAQGSPAHLACFSCCWKCLA